MQGWEDNISKGRREGFQQCYGLKTFLGTLKDEGKGRKRRRGEEKVIQGLILGTFACWFNQSCSTHHYWNDGNVLQLPGCPQVVLEELLPFSSV